jgi:hypothetical protein
LKDGFFFHGQCAANSILPVSRTPKTNIRIAKRLTSPEAVSGICSP